MSISALEVEYMLEADVECHYKVNFGILAEPVNIHDRSVSK